jgi:hypothetical protein
LISETDYVMLNTGWKRKDTSPSSFPSRRKREELGYEKRT